MIPTINQLIQSATTLAQTFLICVAGSLTLVGVVALISGGGT